MSKLSSVSMKKIFFVTGFIILSFYIFLISDGILNDSIPKNNIQTYGVIYWNKVELDGTPSNRLQARLDAGYDLYNEGVISKVIVNLWIWIEWFDEATVMKEFLLEKWINDEDIIIDSDGYTTRETSENLMKILGSDIAVIWISQWFHISRVKLSLRQAWFENVYWFTPKYFEKRDFYSIFREWLAYLKYFLNF